MCRGFQSDHKNYALSTLPEQPKHRQDNLREGITSRRGFNRVQRTEGPHIHEVYTGKVIPVN